jgi:tetratricopeptide (TPR) repeat protein
MASTSLPSVGIGEAESHFLLRLKGVISVFRGVALGAVGDAGIGKTTLVRRVLANLPCARVSIPADIRLVDVTLHLPKAKKTLPDWVNATLSPSRENQGIQPTRFAEALHVAFGQLTPIVVHLEDVHECSPWMLEVWTHLARLAGETRGLGVIATSRENLPKSFDTVQLQRMDLEATRILLNTDSLSPLPDEVIHWVQQRTSGNPLFSLEYLQFLLRQRALWHDGRDWHWHPPNDGRLPRAISGIVAARLEAITQRCTAPARMREWLLELALLPESVLESLGHATRGDAFRTALQSEGVWNNGAFTHPLYREVLQRELWTLERTTVARAHLEASIALAPQEAARVVNAAALTQPALLEAWRHLSRAALGQGDFVMAGRALEAAMPQLSAAECFQAAQWLEGADLAASLRLLEAAHAAEPHEGLYRVHLALSRLKKLQSCDALELLNTTSEDPKLEALRLGVLSQALLQQGDPEQVIQLWHAHGKATEPSILFVTAFTNALRALGRLEEALEFCRDFLERPLEAHLRAKVLNAKGLILYAKNEIDEACACFGAALDVIGRELQRTTTEDATEDLTTFQVELQMNLAAMYNSQNRSADQIELLRQGIEYARERHLVYMLAIALNDLGSTYTQIGAYEQAQSCLLEARELHGTTESSIITIETNLCFLYLEWQPPLGATLALYHARRALSLARTALRAQGLSRTMISLVRAEIAHGDLETASALVAETRSYAQQFQNARLDISTRWLEGLLLERRGEMRAAIAVFQDMVRLSETFPSWYHRERWALELDRLQPDETTIRARLERLRGLGTEARGLLSVAERFFPQLFDASARAVAHAVGQLEVLGEIRLNGKPVPFSHRKVRRLLQFLLEVRLAKRGAASKLELVDRLYPNEPENDAVTSLRQLIMRVRKNFGSEVIQSSKDGYWLGVTSDAETFLETRDITLWRGAYLSPTPTLSDTAQGLYRALHQAMQLEAMNDSDRAARAARLLLESYPLEREDLRVALRVLNDAEDVNLEVCYAAQRRRWADLGEHLPIKWRAVLRD